MWSFDPDQLHRFVTTIRRLLNSFRSDSRSWQAGRGTVVANLLDNTVEYSGEANEIRVRVGDDDGQAFVAVRDFGVGIAPEHVSLLFQRFSRLPTEANVTIPGIGLGLFLCQEIAQRHGGAIEVNSAGGQGSEFTLHIPAGSEEPARKI